MKRTRRKYDAEFKRQTINLVIQDGKSCNSVEKSLGLGQGIVSRWIKEHKNDPKQCFPGNGNLKPSQGDVQKLVKEVDHLKRERDILKKALAIFSQTGPRSTRI